MQSLLLAFCLMAAVASAASLPSARLRRDVSELAVQEPVNDYLPPAEPLEIESTTTIEPKETLTAVEDEEAAKPLGEQGYEYQTVRQLRFRQRRDVSHFPLEYLSTVVLPPLPSRDYLPPVEEQAAPHLNNEYLPPPVNEAVKLSNEYLPPVEEHEHEHEHEALEETTTTEAAVDKTTTTTTEVPTTTTEAPVTDAPVEETKEVEEVKKQEEEEEVVVKETPVELAELAADGYHYRQPDVIPDLSTQPEEEPIDETPVAEPVDEIPVVEEVDEEQLSPIIGDYLPPLDEIDAVAEGPADDESAVLAEDGYHYRAIKRFRF